MVNQKLRNNELLKYKGSKNLVKNMWQVLGDVFMLVTFGSEKLLQFFKSLYLIPLKLLGVAKYKLINIFLKP